jgi:hypothetical protein
MKTALAICAILFGSLIADGQSPKPSPSVPQDGQTRDASPGPNASLALPTEKAGAVSIPFFEKSPVIDGRLGDEAWKSAVVLRDFYQIQPGDNAPPLEPTEVLLGYDAKFLYVAFRAQDGPGKVRAHVAKRDAIFDDDYVGMFLDTFNDKRKAYALFFNPLGIQADGILTEGVSEDYSVDLVIDSKGVVGNDGYVVEAAIPFKSLRYEAGKGKLWGVNFYRRIKRANDELDSWMPFSRDRSGTLNQLGRITSLEHIATERTVELIPELRLSETGERVRALPAAAVGSDPTLPGQGRFVNRPPQYDLGVTGKLGLSPNLTIDFTVHPDFAQVEADQPVVTANQRFPIFFPEKRPFFLEGKEIFETPMTAVHTRAIIAPEYAAKVTGKRGRNTFGLLFAADSGPGSFTEEELSDPATRAAAEGFVNKKAYVGILRLKHDIGRESNIGFLATSYDFVEEHNRLGGFDGRFRLSPQTTFTFQALGTTSRRFFFDPELGGNVYRTGNGFGYSWNLDKAKRHVSYDLGGEGRTRAYRADVGFTPRTNTNDEYFTARYSSEPDPKAKIISWRLVNTVRADFDWQGRMQLWSVRPQFGVTLRHNTAFALAYNRGYERIFEEEFGPVRTATRAGAFAGPDPERATYGNSLSLAFETAPSNKYAASFSASYGTGVFDYDFGAGPRFPRISPAALADPNAAYDPGAGRSLNLYGSFTYQPTAALRTSLDFTKSKLVRDDNGRLAFDDNIFALRATYQFTRFLFARGRLDYDTLTSRVYGEYLLGWSPNPGTAFYAGYNDSLNYNGFNPFTGQYEPGFARNGRTFFIKVSYLFRHSVGQ